jgi:1,4-dihydroxy-2-naphthoyl-CoA synthase
MSAPEALDYMKEMATLVLLTEDAKEGLDAFLAKRKPCWKGR